jgi:hypothetical protein
MHWILILMLGSGSARVAAATTAIFDNEPSCVAAGKLAVDSARDQFRATWVCTPQDGTKPAN